MTPSRKVAITGGSGSGKSEVGRIIAEQGFHVYSCDAIYGELLKNKTFLNKICSAFGNVLNSDGALDRVKLSAMVYGDAEKLKLLDGLTHPEIMKQAINKMEAHALSFCEVPLLFEGGFENLFDKVIIVTRDKEERIKSLMQRDNKSREDIESRLNCQFNYDKLDFAKYYVIHNTGNFDDLMKNTLKNIKKIQEEFYEEQN